MKYDLIVIGAGVMGAFHAYHASKAGKKVLLLDKDYRQKGSSTQNFGQVVPSGMSKKWNTYGQRTLQIYEELQQFHDFTLRKNGSMYIASDADEQLLLEEVQAYHQKNGYHSEPLTAKSLMERYPDIKSSYVKSGLFFPQEMSVDPGQFVYLFTAFMKEKKYVDYLSGACAVDIEETSAACIVKLASGQKYEAEKVLLCCGYTFQILYPEVFKNSGIVVSKLQMLQTKPLPSVRLKGNILTGLTIRRYEAFEECPSFASIQTPMHLQELKDQGIHILFKQADDGSIILGDSHEYAAVTDLHKLGNHSNEHIDLLMMHEVARIVDITPEDINKRWSGFYAQHPDKLFEKNISENIHIITGIGGKGMTSCAGFAEESIRSLLHL